MACIAAIRSFLQHAAERARRPAAPWGIVTFEPHPRTFFKPEEPVFRLTPPDLKGRLAAALGAAFIIHLPFDERLARLEAEDFIRKVLVRADWPSAMSSPAMIFTSARAARAIPRRLKRQWRSLRLWRHLVDQVSDDGDGRSPFSSSSIRTSLRRGHVEAAARELGYQWMVMGEVVHGDKRGRTIGFPTVNIVLEKGAEPFRGIYAVLRARCATRRDAAPWLGAGYFGDRPTFDSPRTFVEVYLLGPGPRSLWRTLFVEFIQLIRPDKRFPRIDELVAADEDRLREGAATFWRQSACRPGGFSFRLAQAQAEGDLISASSLGPRSDQAAGACGR